MSPLTENESPNTLSRRPTIAIDGPAASGKTTVGRLLACRLGLRFLDTGIMYRALAWEAICQCVPLSDGPALSRLARGDIFSSVVEEGVGCTYAGHGADPRSRNEKLYTAEVDAASSEIAQWPDVREALVKQQQAMAAQGSMVMVGRDIGTVVAPGADLKVFLVASAETRAHRRALQAGDRDAYERILADIVERDERDTQRSHSPLAVADDAHKLDTEGIDPEEVVERIIAWAGGL